MVVILSGIGLMKREDHKQVKRIPSNIKTKIKTKKVLMGFGGGTSLGMASVR